IKQNLWQHLFGRQADRLEKSANPDTPDEYMIVDNEPLVNRFVSVPRELSQLNCAAFVAGIVEGACDGAGFPARERPDDPVAPPAPTTRKRTRRPPRSRHPAFQSPPPSETLKPTTLPTVISTLRVCPQITLVNNIITTIASFSHTSTMAYHTDDKTALSHSYEPVQDLALPPKAATVKTTEATHGSSPASSTKKIIELRRDSIPSTPHSLRNDNPFDTDVEAMITTTNTNNNNN
ncbi:hypothetical protein BN1723_017672, partial [Verticillium longisporum]